MKRTATLLRRVANRIDKLGAPRRTGWSFTIEEGLGAVFNRDGKGCPVYYNGEADYRRAHDESRFPDGPYDMEWVTVGFRDQGEVTVLGSADISARSFTRAMTGYDEVDFSGSPRVGKIPRWVIGLTFTLRTWVQVNGKDYPEAVKSLFDR
jgi:hypothetical protein